MATRMQQRRGTAAQWVSTNSGNGPILNAGEIGYETDTNKFKIGDGTNHWINLDYFIDANSTVNPAFGSSITFEGATANNFETTLAITDPTADRTITFPDATGTVALTSDIAELSQDAIDSALTAGTGITKTYNDAANTLTIAVDTTAIQARVTDVSDTEIGYLNGVTSAIQTQLDSKATPANITTAINNIIDGAPAALNTLNELAAALGDDPAFLASLATESYVNTAIGNIDALPEQNTNSGKFLTTDGSTASWATVDLTSKQDVVSGVSDTEIGYLDGVTSAIQTQLNNKLEASDLAGLATEEYVDTAVSGATFDASLAAGDGLVWNPGTSQFDVGTLASPTISSSLTLDGTGDFTISADANIILDATTEVYIGSASSGNEVATKSYADAAAAAIVDAAPSTLNTLNELATALGNDASFSTTVTNSLAAKAPLNSPTFTGTVSGISKSMVGLANVDNTSDVSKPISNATQTALDLKANLAGPTFTGNVSFTGATVTGIPSYNAPTLGSTSIASGATVSTIAGLTLTAPTLTGTVTASGDINLSAANGPGSVIDELTLLLMGAI